MIHKDSLGSQNGAIGTCSDDFLMLLDPSWIPWAKRVSWGHRVAWGPTEGCGSRKGRAGQARPGLAWPAWPYLKCSPSLCGHVGNITHACMAILGIFPTPVWTYRECSPPQCGRIRNVPPMRKAPTPVFPIPIPPPAFPPFSLSPGPQGPGGSCNAPWSGLMVYPLGLVMYSAGADGVPLPFPTTAGGRPESCN